MENKVDHVGVFFEEELPDKKIKVENLFGNQSTLNMPTLNRPNPNGVFYQRNASFKKKSTGLTSIDLNINNRPPDLQEPFSYDKENDFLDNKGSSDIEDDANHQPPINELEEEDFMSIAKRKFLIERFYKVAELNEKKLYEDIYKYFRREIMADLNKNKKLFEIFDLIGMSEESETRNHLMEGDGLKESYIKGKISQMAASIKDAKQFYKSNMESGETIDKFYQFYITREQEGVGYTETIEDMIVTFLQIKFKKQIKSLIQML